MKREVRNKLIFSLISSTVFSLLIILLISITNNFLFILLTPVLVLLSEFVLSKKQDLFVSILLTFLFVLLNDIILFSPFLLSFLMLFIPVYYFRNNSSKELLKKLGFNGSILRAIFYSIGLLVPLFVLYIILVLIAYSLGLNDSQMVVDKVLDLPIYLMFYAVLVAPLVEEVFFRSFLPYLFMSKTSFLSKVPSEIVSSFIATLLFSLAHISYGSVFEIIGTFFLGYALYVTYRISKDIKVAIFIHMIINLVSLIAMHLMM